MNIFIKGIVKVCVISYLIGWIVICCNNIVGWVLFGFLFINKLINDCL